jgi:hypothetical protein
MVPDSIPAYLPFHGGAAGQAYNQAAFHHFLTIERRRAVRFTRSLLLVLVSVRESPGRSATLNPTMSAALFAGLGASVREVDFVGWYREGQVAAAVLMQPVMPAPDFCRRLAARVMHAVGGHVPGNPLLRVRVVSLGGRSDA